MGSVGMGAVRAPHSGVLALVDEASVKDDPTPDEKVGLTVWIAVKQKKFTARSSLELTRHPHHQGAFRIRTTSELTSDASPLCGVPFLVEGQPDRRAQSLKRR